MVLNVLIGVFAAWIPNTMSQNKLLLVLKMHYDPLSRPKSSSVSADINSHNDYRVEGSSTAEFSI